MPTSSIDLLDIKRGTVTAPAGCGKTHLIAEAITKHDEKKPILVLTHTNAGVAALRNRLEQAGVPRKGYRLSTIDGWAMRLISTFPKRSECDPKILELANPKTDYPNIRTAAAKMLKAGHALDIIASSYSRLLVDEYQDCNVPQHAIAYYMSPALPTCVLGDPMQAIFDFAGKLAHWDDHVCKHFPLVGELSTPWRWKNVNEETFGLWLLDARRKLLAGKAIDLTTAHKNVSWIRTDGKDAHELRLGACQTKAPNKDGTVLIIGDSTNPTAQKQFASQTPGAIAVESVDLRDLVSFAQKLDLRSGKGALKQVVEFAGSVMTNVGGAELLNRIESLRRGTARKSANKLENMGMRFAAAPSYAGVRELLGEFGEQGGRCHRPGILRGCIRALQMAEPPDGPTFYEAAINVREQSRALGRPLPRRAVGSTLLLKGLEADVSVILNADVLNRQNLYVAMTRGSRRLVVCANKSVLKPG